MRKLLTLGVIFFTTAAICFASGIGTAQASSHNECGDLWRTIPTIGEKGRVIYNITSRNVSCQDARSFASKLWPNKLPYHSGSIRLRGWKTYYGKYREFDHGARVDLRATRGNKVIRMQYYTDYC